MADKSKKKTAKEKTATRRGAAKPKLLAGGNPQIPKADGDAPAILSSSEADKP